MQKRIAILGAGQLAKYLVGAGQKLGLEVTVVATSASEPACQETHRTVIAEWTPELMFQVFLEHDIVTFENEWISDSLLSKVIAEGLLGKLLPSHESMIKVRTKWNQKQFFLAQSYPTARAMYSKQIDLSSISKLKELLQLFPNGVVVKESELAYDGKGVFVFEKNEAEKIFGKLKKLNKDSRPWYLEEKISFAKELSLVFSRTKKGDFTHFPLVEFESEKGICSTVFVEGKNTGLMNKLEIQAVKIARDLSGKLQWCGTAAIEFFYSDSQGLLINEFAPRVHNSGHFSLSASRTSQFENHLRAIIGMPLGSCETAPFAVMKNFLGTQESNLAICPTSNNEVQVFWYGKKEIRPGRKMGHISAFGDLSERASLIEKVNQVVKNWQLSTIG